MRRSRPSRRTTSSPASAAPSCPGPARRDRRPRTRRTARPGTLSGVVRCHSLTWPAMTGFVPMPAAYDQAPAPNGVDERREGADDEHGETSFRAGRAAHDVVEPRVAQHERREEERPVDVRPQHDEQGRDPQPPRVARPGRDEPQERRDRRRCPTAAGAAPAPARRARTRRARGSTPAEGACRARRRRRRGGRPPRTRARHGARRGAPSRRAGTRQRARPARAIAGRSRRRPRSCTSRCQTAGIAPVCEDRLARADLVREIDRGHRHEQGDERRHGERDDQPEAVEPEAHRDGGQAPVLAPTDDHGRTARRAARSNAAAGTRLPTRARHRGRTRRGSRASSATGPAGRA